MIASLTKGGLLKYVGQLFQASSLPNLIQFETSWYCRYSSQVFDFLGHRILTNVAATDETDSVIQLEGLIIGSLVDVTLTEVERYI